MKRSLKFHRDCLRNMKEHLEYIQREVARQQSAAQQTMEDIALAEYQIAEAERMGINEFDPDRFRVSRPRTRQNTR